MFCAGYPGVHDPASNGACAIRARLDYGCLETLLHGLRRALLTAVGLRKPGWWISDAFEYVRPLRLEINLKWVKQLIKMRNHNIATNRVNNIRLMGNISFAKMGILHSPACSSIAANHPNAGPRFRSPNPPHRTVAAEVIARCRRHTSPTPSSPIQQMRPSTPILQAQARNPMLAFPSHPPHISVLRASPSSRQYISCLISAYCYNCFNSCTLVLLRSIAALHWACILGLPTWAFGRSRVVSTTRALRPSSTHA